MGWRRRSGSLLIRALGPILVTSSKLNFLPKDPPPNTITLGLLLLLLRASTYLYWGKGAETQSVIGIIALKSWEEGGRRW